jgi:heptaprenyl diphosphate synthase
MKSFDQFQFRSRRREVYERHFDAASLCLFGILILPAFLFNNNLQFRIVQFLGLWFLCWLAGKKNNPLMTLLVIFGIVVFNLMAPHGRLLFSLGTIKITSGALVTGLQRAVTLEGLIMLSRFSIRRDLKIPGGFGELIAESFRFFALITDSKKKIRRKNFMEDIDRLMIELSEKKPEPRAEAMSPVNRAPGFIILVSLGILFWLPLFFSLIFMLAETLASSQPVLITLTSVFAPSKKLKAPIIMDFPAPVSPVSMFNPS